MYRVLCRSAGLLFHLAMVQWKSLSHCHEAVDIHHVEQRQAIQTAAQGDLCYVSNHRSAVLGDRLYFMGGQYTFQGGDPNSAEQKLYWLDLNTSFPVDSSIPSNLIHSIAAPADSQWTGGTGAFFTSPDQTGLYSFGGFLDDDTEHNSTWLFNSSSARWSNVTVSGGPLNKLNRDGSMHTSTKQGLSFLNGGWDSTRGMVVFNNSDPQNLFWTNQTQIDTPSTMGATMQYLQYGKAGILIAFGGYDTSYVNPQLRGWSWNQRPMDQMMIYDIDSATWYNVTASGDIPSQRSEFCAVTSAAPDDSSFQITVYGGWDIFGLRAFEDVYVLSIPSFRWIKVDDQHTTNMEAKLPGKIGRMAMTCHTRQGRQMLVLGGTVRLNSDFVNAQACNASYPAIRLLDTTTFSWSNQYQSVTEPYGVPQVVYQIIGGSASGGATMRQPSKGFNDTFLSQIFSRTVARNVTSTSVPFSSASTSNHKPSSPVGLAVGGTVGGLGLLGITAVTIFFCLWWWRRKRLNSGSDRWEKSELSGHSHIPRGQQQQHYELAGEQLQPRYELGGSFHGVEADSHVRR